MFTDITGKRRLKACLHLHTTLSDGDATPEEVLKMYEEAGYDILAITDHYRYHPAMEHGKLRVISGAEYHLVGPEVPGGICETYHVLALDMKEDPLLSNAFIGGESGVRQRTRDTVAAVRKAGGAAILAHPAWSLNTPQQVMDCGEIDGTEIYNSVSQWGMSDRPYSGQIVDMVATQGMILPLLATDDAHYYDGDQMRGITMLEADAVEELGVAGAIRAGRFYATQGPEIHLERISPTEVRVRCSPVVKIVFLSNAPWAQGRVQKGTDLTEAVFTLDPTRGESYIRAEVTDVNGLQAWSNILKL